MSIFPIYHRLIQPRRFGPLLALLLLTTPAFASLGSLGLRATPELVRADGHSTTTITVEVRDGGGSIVPDGTEVHFTTTAGRIDEAAPTVAGRARVTFTSDSIPAIAQVSAFAGTSSGTISIRMVEDPEALSPRGHVLQLEGKYVAYSESRGVLEAIGEARLTWKGQRITAQAVQADLFNNVIRARGGVKVEGREKKKRRRGEEEKRGGDQAVSQAAPGSPSLSSTQPSVSTPQSSLFACDQLAVDMVGDQATVIQGDSRQVIDFPSLTVLVGTRTAPNPLEWADLTDSDMLWVADRVIAVPGQKVQLRKAAAYMGGQRIARLPYHEISLQEGLSSQGQQYLGVGTYGLAVDLPYYLGMSPGASTSLRLRHGVRSGFGWYGTNPGWELDLERRYGLPGANEGTITLGRVTSSDWGLHWDHTQHLARGTQAYALLEYPAHRDLFANLNLSRNGRMGSLNLNLSGHKLRSQGFGRTIDLNAQTTPRAISGSGFRLSLESRVYDAREGDFVAFDGKRYAVAPSFSRELGLRLTPPLLKLGRGGVSSWLSVQHVWGGGPITIAGKKVDRSGLGLAGALAFNHPLGRMGGMSLNYSYNQFPGNTFYGTAGRQNLSGSLRLTPTPRLFLGAFGSLGLDSPTRTISASAAYSFGPLWRLELQQTAYHFRSLQEADLQVGLSRAIGQRALTLYWSRLRHRLMFEITGGGF